MALNMLFIDMMVRDRSSVSICGSIVKQLLCWLRECFLAHTQTALQCVAPPIQEGILAQEVTLALFQQRTMNLMRLKHMLKVKDFDE